MLIVKAFGFDAEIVPDAPKAIVVPLMVTCGLAICALVTVPLNAVVGMVVDAVMVLVPLPYT